MSEQDGITRYEQEEDMTKVSSEQRREDMATDVLSTDSDDRCTDSPSTTWDKLMMNDLGEFPTRTTNPGFLHDGGVTAFDVMSEDATSGDTVADVRIRGEKRSGDMNVIGTGKTMLVPPKIAALQGVSSGTLGILPPVQRQFGVESSSGGLITQQQQQQQQQQYQVTNNTVPTMEAKTGGRSLPPPHPPSSRELQKQEQPTVTTATPAGKTISTAIRRRRSVSSLSTRVQELLIAVIERAAKPRSILKRACGIVEPGEPGYGDCEALIQTWERVRDSRGRHVLMTGRSTFAVLPHYNEDALTPTTEQPASATSDATTAKDTSMPTASASAGNVPSQMDGTPTVLETASAQGATPTPTISGRSGGRNARGFSAFRHASRQYYFHTDALDGHMDLPGRVWSQCTWEYSHNAQLYDRAEYARIWIAASTGVHSSLAVPVIYPAVLKPGLGRMGGAVSGSAVGGKGSLQQHNYQQRGDMQSGVRSPQAASMEYLGRPTQSEQVVAVLEVVHSSSITDVRPLLNAVSVLLNEVGLRAGGFKPYLPFGPDIPSLRTNEERAAAELSALMNQMCDTMDLPLVQLWKVLPTALGTPTIMVTGTLPFVTRGDLNMKTFREACCNVALADGIGPVGCCKQHGGSPQWWPRVGAELMCNFPVAHVARAKKLNGIVAMGVRWTGSGPKVDVNDRDASAAATLDFVIECVLPVGLVDPFSQKDVAVKCCESLWQLSSRDEYHLFPLTGDGMATSVTLRGGFNGGTSTSMQVALFSSNMGDVSALSDQTTSQVAQGMASMMSPAAAVDVRASGMGAGGSSGGLPLARALQPTAAGHGTSSYQQHPQRGFFTTNDVKSSGGAVIPVSSDKGIFQFTSVLPLEQQQQQQPLSLSSADNRHTDLSSVSMFRGMDASGGRVVDKHGMGVQLRTAHETGAGSTSTVKMNMYNDGVLPLLSPGFVVHFVGTVNEAAGLDPSMRPSNASGNSIAHVNINAHDPLALEEVRNALMLAGLVVQIGHECMVGRNRYISMVVSRPPSWAGHRSSMTDKKTKRWVYSDTWKVMAAFEAFGFLTLPTPLLSFTRDESADMKFAAECLSELRAIETELLEDL